MKVTWHGDQIKRATGQAVMRGMDETMSAAAIHAKRNHQGWINQTGKAEGSIRIQERAHKVGAGLGFVGVWGSVNVFYFLFLELKHGNALQNAASIHYPKLVANIRKAMT